MDARSTVIPRAGRRWNAIALGAALALLAASGAAQIVAAPAALLSYAEGGVAFALKGDKEWLDVKSRRALARGDRVWTDRGARAEVQAGVHTVRMDSQTQLSVEATGESATQVSVMRGTVAISVSRLAPGENVEVGTPNLAFRARQVGEYRIDVDAHQGTTRVSVMSGGGVVFGEHGESVDMAAGQRLTFKERVLAKSPTPAFTTLDTFDRWIVARARGDAAAAAASSAASAVHPDVVAKAAREQEAQRQAQAKLEGYKTLDELQAAQRARQQARKDAQIAAGQAAAAAKPALAAVQVPPVTAPAPAVSPPVAMRPAELPVARSVQRAAEARRAMEERRIADARFAAESKRASLAKRSDEDRRIAMSKRAAEERRTALVAQAAARKLEQERRTTAAQAALAARRLEQEKKLAIARKAEQDRKLVAAKRAETERLLAKARRDQEIAHQQAVGEARAAQLVKLQLQAHKEEEASREQRARREEQARKEEQSRQARREEEARREDVAHREDEARKEAWERRQRAMAEQQKRDHEVWLRNATQSAPYRPQPQGVPARRVM